MPGKNIKCRRKLPLHYKRRQKYSMIRILIKKQHLLANTCYLLNKLIKKDLFLISEEN